MFGYFQHEGCKGLERKDFFRFAKEFRQVIHENIPTIENVTFFDPPEQQPAVSSRESKEEKELRQSMEMTMKKGRPVISGNSMFLPFPVGDSSVVAQVTGLDDYLVRKVANDWLDKLSLLLLREFLLVKRACIDPLTGLLSSLHLEEYLDSSKDLEQGVLVLVTVFPKSSSSFQAREYQHRTVSLLTDFLEDRFPLYYLGQSCFGLVCENCDSDFAAEFAPSLVNYLKRKRCSRVHVASAAFGGITEQTKVAQPLSEEIMKKAWTALHVASRRGPFAFCNFSSIEDADNHPLAPPSPLLVRWLQTSSRKLDEFSLVQFDIAGEKLIESLMNIVGHEARYYTDNNSVFLLLQELSGKEAVNTGREILQNLSKTAGAERAVNAGISSFPLANFKKAELLQNCRKALCHAAFLEPGSLVCCDAVSFNVSGDIYYGDGDLVLAVKEYQRGLLFDSSDGNLLNSLGVCYAQMNKHKLAVECFRKASKSKADRFMALYNLGMEQQIQDENEEAIDSFTRALALTEKEGEEKARNDMSFQLSVLCIQEGEYQKGLDFLFPWYENEKANDGGQSALRYLGMACYGLGRHQDAMRYLQQAMRYDEYDAEVLGLLGEIYLKENEGDDIALRLCEKAAELSPYSLGLKLRLANAQIHCGDYANALKNLQSCLRSKKYRPAALLQRGMLALEQGQLKNADQWFAKVESCPGSDSVIVREAHNYLKDLRKGRSVEK
ncbi:MAG TPA: tetratricopeptide repeat protein [Desulfobacterales bacterium]|nr:tetratricopeptide repeat protein [Desulfobacterales bacterium]HIP38640.1 tetratricopeptide repeat protein [Desulfocapsa sulfexigens]